MTSIDQELREKLQPLALTPQQKDYLMGLFRGIHEQRVERLNLQSKIQQQLDELIQKEVERRVREWLEATQGVDFAQALEDALKTREQAEKDLESYRQIYGETIQKLREQIRGEK